MQIKAEIDYITYYNSDNYFIIAKATEVNDEDMFSSKTITIKGKIPMARVNMTLLLDGDWIEDKKYGKQFAFTTYEEVMPTTQDGIKAYLASGLVKGIGPKTASLIIKVFGEKTLDILNSDPERLIEVKGIGKKKCEEIVECLKSQKMVRETMIFLKTYGITDSLAAKIYKAYGDDTIEIVSEDPYRLADDIDMVGFKKADEIALRMGIGPLETRRIETGIKFVLKTAASDKDTYLPFDNLVKLASSYEYLNVNQHLVKETMLDMCNKKELVNDEDKIYLPRFYDMEQHVALMLANKATNDMFDNIFFSDDIINGDVEYSDEQIEALKLASKSKMIIITGGPGTGKTTLQKGLISLFEQAQQKVLLAAPTGRAAKRMSETTNREAKTIHRLLEWKDGPTRCKEIPLEGDVLILDECSMINLTLMEVLLSAIPERMKVIMIGDVDQLPPIGCGNVLKDSIDSGLIPTIRLTKIFRQDAKSKIITNAHKINEEVMPDLNNEENTDFWYFNVQDTEKVKANVIRLVTEAIPKKFGFNADDVQVLTPMRKKENPVGSIQLNVVLQEALNPKGTSLSNGLYRIRIGDRVMQNANNYELGVFNGDLGTVTDIDTERNIITVSYADDEIEYDKSNFNELELAYATTIHKSQGSEYPVVIMVADKSQWIMLQKQLFYTAVTRAKKMCILISTDEAVKKMVTTKPTDVRYSFLKERINEYIERIKQKRNIKF